MIRIKCILVLVGQIFSQKMKFNNFKNRQWNRIDLLNLINMVYVIMGLMDYIVMSWRQL